MAQPLEDRRYIDTILAGPPGFNWKVLCVRGFFHLKFRELLIGNIRKPDGMNAVHTAAVGVWKLTHGADDP